MVVTPSVGWGVLHLFYRVDRARLEHDPQSVKHLHDAVLALQAAGHQVVAAATLGHKADLCLMAVGPDLARLHAFQQQVLSAPLVPTYSYVSLTELSPYTTTEADERARLEAEEQLTGAAAEERLVAWRERMQHYQENRIHPQLPAKRMLCFYPMTKRRDAANNWYTLPFDERKRLMAGHGRIGRTYAGRVIQLITGSTGLDDWEWGVTLFADDPVVLKDIVHEMRFDAVSAEYGEFGQFFVGLAGSIDDVISSVGLDGGHTARDDAS